MRKRERLGEQRQLPQNTTTTAGFAVAVLGCLILLTGCAREDPRLANLKTMENPGIVSGPERVRELEKLIEDYQEIVNQKIQAGVRQAGYLKLLSQEYVRQELFGLALETLEEAIFLEPQNQVLHQLAGVSAAYVAKAQGTQASRDSYLEIAERHYIRSVELDPNYLDALYSLAILYVFEMDEPYNALTYLDALLARSTKHIPALFVFARAHAELGNLDEAVRAYDVIIEEADDREVRQRAERNRQLLLGGS